MARPKVGGIFVSTGASNSPIDEAIIELPFVVGFSVRTDWADVEREDGVFNWSFIDQQLARAQRMGKLVILRVTAGANSPTWVYSKGAAGLPIGAHRRGKAHPAQAPLPWDPVMLREWQQFVATLGKRYDGRPNLFAVAMAGPTFYHDEMILPSYMPWEEAGYSEDKLIQAWKTTLDSYGQAFQETPFSLAINPIPIPSHPGSLEPAKQVVSYGLATFGSRLLVQGNWLSDTFPEIGNSGPYNQLYQLIADSSQRTTVGFQVGGRKLSGLLHQGSVTSDVGRALLRALDAGASYVEVNYQQFARREVRADMAKLAPSFAGEEQP